MDVDPYRLAYNVFHNNWIKFGISPENISPPRTEKVNSLDAIIPGFSTAVVLFQIASRKDLKTFLDEDCPTAYNLRDVYTLFTSIMREVLDKDTVVENPPNDEDLSQDTMEEFLSEENSASDLPNDVVQEGILVDIGTEKLPGVAVKESILVDIGTEKFPGVAVKKSSLEGNKKESLLDNAMKDGPTRNIIHFDDIPNIIAYSLAVCTELVLYEREDGNIKQHINSMSDMWEKYFDENLKPICNKAGYTQYYLQQYSDSIECHEEVLDRFISENKNEYDDIAGKFFDYTEKHSPVQSPDHSKLKFEVGSLSKGMSFRKMKKKFAAVKAIFKCFSQNVKREKTIEEIQLVTDRSHSSSCSTPTSLI